MLTARATLTIYWNLEEYFGTLQNPLSSLSWALSFSYIGKPVFLPVARKVREAVAIAKMPTVARCARVA